MGGWSEVRGNRPVSLRSAKVWEKGHPAIKSDWLSGNLACLPVSHWTADDTWQKSKHRENEGGGLHRQEPRGHRGQDPPAGKGRLVGRWGLGGGASLAQAHCNVKRNWPSSEWAWQNCTTGPKTERASGIPGPHVWREQRLVCRRQGRPHSVQVSQSCDMSLRLFWCKAKSKKTQFQLFNSSKRWRNRQIDPKTQFQMLTQLSFYLKSLFSTEQAF